MNYFIEDKGKIIDKESGFIVGIYKNDKITNLSCVFAALCGFDVDGDAILIKPNLAGSDEKPTMKWFNYQNGMTQDYQMKITDSKIITLFELLCRTGAVYVKAVKHFSYLEPLPSANHETACLIRLSKNDKGEYLFTLSGNGGITGGHGFSVTVDKFDDIKPILAEIVLGYENYDFFPTVFTDDEVDIDPSFMPQKLFKVDKDTAKLAIIEELNTKMNASFSYNTSDVKTGSVVITRMWEFGNHSGYYPSKWMINEHGSDGNIESYQSSWNMEEVINIIDSMIGRSKYVMINDCRNDIPSETIYNLGL